MLGSYIETIIYTYVNNTDMADGLFVKEIS